MKFFVFALFLFPSWAFADFTLNPERVDFGHVQVGFYKRETVVLKNISDEVIILHFNGICDRDIGYLSSSCRGGVPPQKFCFIDVYFEPRIDGAQRCRLRVTDSLDSQQELVIRGRGVNQP